LIAILGSKKDTLTITGEYVYANDFEVRLRALTDLAKDQRLDGTGILIGGINFAWLLLWFLSPDSLNRKSDYFKDAEVKPPCLGGESVGRASTLHFIRWHLP